jgi:type IV secretory pathway VirJ component
VLASTPSRDVLAVILSGDGGWAGIDREIAGVLAKKHVPVVGVNSLRYFWKSKTPENAAADLERILKAYMALWNKDKVALIGYSLGADVLPFMANRLPPDLLSRVALITLLGPDTEVDFEFHLMDWLGGRSRSSKRILPEVAKLEGKRLLCVYGEEERESLCRQLSDTQARVVSFKGAHHLGGNYEAITNIILGEIER